MLHLPSANVLLTEPHPRAAANDSMKSEEFNTEFLKIKDSAFRYAMSLLRDRHTAEDAVQDLYEKLWRRRLLIGRERFQPLVMVSMRNMCLDRMRRRDRDRRMTDLRAAENRHAAEAGTDAGVTDETVRRLMAALPQREREAMHLRDIEGLEFARIAQITGTTEAAARMACSRARNKVKEELIKIMNHGL